MRRPALTTALLAGSFALVCASAGEAVVARAHAAPSSTTVKAQLYWSRAPRAGTVLKAKAGHRLSFTLAASDRHAERVYLSVLGRAPVKLSTRSGNPARATVIFTPSRSLTAATAVTFVARTSRGLAITRTVVLAVTGRTAAPSGASLTRWSYVLTDVAARTAPRSDAPLITKLTTATPDQMPNLVVVFGLRKGPRGESWAHVRLSTLPNGRNGWVPRAALSALHVVSTRLVVDTRRLTLTLYRRGKTIFHTQVGVGTPSAPTPHGSFYIREKLTSFSDPFYGPLAFGTNARSAVLTEWPGGGIIGIHGTNQPWLIPGQISHGCIRLRNADLVRLARLLPLGTPVIVR